MRRGMIVLGAVCLLLTLTPAFAEGADWPQFRGIHRDGVSPETGLSASWPEGGPKELMRVKLGEGYSAISVVGDRFYTMYAVVEDDGATEYAAAFNVKDGKELWRTAMGPKFDNEFGNGPRATPTVVDGQMFVLDSTGLFAALNAKDGAVQWKIDFKEKFKMETPRFGYSTSALVDGDHVIVQTGGAEDNNYVAFDKKTGEVKWARGSGRAGYNSALAVTVAGAKRYVYVTDKLYCIDEKGEEVWAHDWPQGETHAMPIHIAPDKIYLSGAEGIGAKLFQVKEDGGKGEATLLWEQPFMRNHFSTAVVHDGFIFGFDNATLKAISLETGEMAWGKRGLGKGSLILADGKLVVLSDRGKLLLVAATGEGYKELGQVQALEGLCWTAPTLAHGRLYLRNHDELVVYSVK